MGDRTYTPREAYEEDCRLNPFYFDGARRPSWDALGDVARSSWVKNPTPRPARAFVKPTCLKATREAS